MVLPKSPLCITTIFILLYIFCSKLTNCVDNEEDKQSSAQYGSDWVLFPDDLGTLHFVNLTYVPRVVDPPRRRIHFQLYTRKNPVESEELFIDVEEEEYGDEVQFKYENNKRSYSKYFSPENPLKMLSHGWQSHGNSSTVINMKDAYLNTVDVNVIIIDWGEIAKEPTYAIAAETTRYVGRQVGRMVKTIIKKYSFNESKVHLVGHSLGAHIVGFGGRYLNSKNLTIYRATGLDPARPLFEFPPIDSIRPSDANFVDIIHTNGGILGERNSHGDADFYPNSGGPHQPSCNLSSELTDACSHGMAHILYTDSIINGGYKSHSCESWSSYKRGNCDDNEFIMMGEQCSSQARGDYYLRT